MCSVTVGGRFIPGCGLIEGENKTRFKKCSDKFAESALQELIERKDAGGVFGNILRIHDAVYGHTTLNAPDLV